MAKALLPASDRPNASIQTGNDTALSERRRGAARLAADNYGLMLRARTPTCCSTWTAGLGFRSASPTTAAADRPRAALLIAVLADGINLAATHCDRWPAPATVQLS